MHDMTKYKTKDKNPTTEGITYHIAENGKSRSYKYGEIHAGCYNTPPLREDLVPRSRTERTPDIRNGDGPRVPRWLLGRNGATTSLSGI